MNEDAYVVSEAGRMVTHVRVQGPRDTVALGSLPPIHSLTYCTTGIVGCFGRSRTIRTGDAGKIVF